MREYPLILERVINTPLLAHPEKAEIVAAVVLRQQGMDITVSGNPEFMNAPALGPLQEKRMVEQSRGVPYLFDQHTGIAVINVTGSLAHRQGHIGKSSGVMGYDGISAQVRAAGESSAVKGIILDIHSAGGEVAGAFQLGDLIAETRKNKRIVAISDEMAYSGAYLIAAAADEVWLASNTAGVGSVGVVMVHFSFEQRIADDGIKTTIIQAGAHKADGNPYEDLAPDVEKRIQAKIDFVYGEFVSRVAMWRGISESAVRATEADTLMGPEAVSKHLANGIADPVEVFQALASEVNSKPALRAV